jgi:exosortase A
MSAIPADVRLASPWRRALPAVLALIGLLLVLYRDTGLDMVGIWSRSDTFAHGFLVAPISAWLIWRDRERLLALTPRPSLAALLPLSGAALVWLVADLVMVNAAAQFALVAMLVLAVPTVLGWHAARALAFPLLFLFFAVPFGEFMLPTMMEWTADFAVAALQWSGIPVYREGLQFVIPSGTWSVVEECSGVRYLIASFMVGTLFAHLNYRSWHRRALFMAISVAVPIVANWLRAYMIVMIGHLSGNRLAVGVDHLVYGWLFFGIVIAIMFAIGARWADAETTPAPAAAPPRDGTTAVTPPLLAWMLAAFVATLPPLLTAGLRHAEGAAEAPRLELPVELAKDWRADDTQRPAWAPKPANPSLEVARVYRSAAGTVGVHVAYFRGQQRDRKLVSSQNGWADAREWNVTQGDTQQLDVPPHAATARTAELLGARRGAVRAHVLAWRLYWVDGRYIGGDVAAKLAQAFARLRGRGDDGAVLMLHTDADGANAATLLHDFAAANFGALDATLRRVRDTR